MEEENSYEKELDYTLHPVCQCFLEPAVTSEHEYISARKEHMLNTVVTTETYLRERRIPELIRFLLTMLISHSPKKPMAFLEKLIDDCMLFRAGHGSAPVLFETRHLEAVIKSFDPCQRGWLSTGQVRRLFTTLGLPMEENQEFIEEKISCNEILEKIKKYQEEELYDLLSAGMVSDIISDYLKSDEVN